METHASAPGLPLRTMGMVPQPAHERPLLPAVARLEQRRRLHSRVEHAGLFGPRRGDLPDALQRRTRVLGKPDVGGLAIRPGLAEIVAGADHRPEVEALRGGPQPSPAGAVVVGHRVDSIAREVRPAALPRPARLVGAEEERALHGADHDQSVAALRGNVAYVDHGDPPPVATR